MLTNCRSGFLENRNSVLEVQLKLANNITNIKLRTRATGVRTRCETSRTHEGAVVGACVLVEIEPRGASKGGKSVTYETGHNLLPLVLVAVPKSPRDNFPVIIEVDMPRAES